MRLLYYLPMERMDRGDLLYIGTAYVGAHTFKGNDYVTVRDFSTTTNALSKNILELEEENKKLKEDVDYFRQCYLDLKKLCEKEGFMLSDEEVTKMFNLDEIK